MDYIYIKSLFCLSTSNKSSLFYYFCCKSSHFTIFPFVFVPMSICKSWPKTLFNLTCECKVHKLQHSEVVCVQLPVYHSHVTMLPAQKSVVYNLHSHAVTLTVSPVLSLWVSHPLSFILLKIMHLTDSGAVWDSHPGCWAPDSVLLTTTICFILMCIKSLPE